MIRYIIIMMFIISCKTTKKEEPIRCCDKETAHAPWDCGKEVEYKYSELLTK